MALLRRETRLTKLGIWTSFKFERLFVAMSSPAFLLVILRVKTPHLIRRLGSIDATQMHSFGDFVWIFAQL